MPQIEQIGSFLMILLIFVLLLYGSYVCSKKVAGMSMRGTQSKYVKVVDRIMLGRDNYIAVISVGNRYYLIGNSAGGMNMLTEIAEEDLVELKNPQGPFMGTPSFKEIMQKLGREKEKDTKL